jgi:hypothetical protein
VPVGGGNQFIAGLHYSVAGLIFFSPFVYVVNPCMHLHHKTITDGLSDAM